MRLTKILKWEAARAGGFDEVDLGLGWGMVGGWRLMMHMAI